MEIDIEAAGNTASLTGSEARLQFAGAGRLPIEAGHATAHARAHIRFILAALAVVLTVGAGWGMMLLWQIGMRGSFTGGSLFHVNAHGHAQIFGWVGLFIMGMGYRLFPGFWGSTHAVRSREAALAFGLMLGGIVLATAGMSVPGETWSQLLAATGGTLELAAIMIYGWQMLRIERSRTVPRDPADGFILVALAWFAAQTAMNLWHTHRTLSAATEDALIWQVSAYQAPLRDMQVHGMAVMMILGVSLKLLPRWFRLNSAPARRNWMACSAMTLAVIAECLIFVAYRWTGHHALAALLMVPWIMLAAGVAVVALPWRLWQPLVARDGVPDRSAKFIRIAYAWLALSLTMLLALPVYQALSGIPFSHAYYGAIRHAITVGFISMMILGMGARILTRRSGEGAGGLAPLWLPWVLVNVGCALRVSLQTATDFYPTAYTFVGISGVLELTGITIWAMEIVRLVRAGSAWQSPTLATETPAQA
jgi:hypothetical protein